MDDSSKELNQLSQELRTTEEAFRKEFERIASGWQLDIGPVRIRGVFGPARVTVVLVVFNAICFAAGVIFIFLGGVFVSLGVAIIVGALFSFGAFLTQFYAISFQREHEMLDRYFADARDADLKTLAAKRTELRGRIERLSDASPPSNVTEGDPGETLSSDS